MKPQGQEDFQEEDFPRKSQEPPPLCFINYRPGATESPARLGQVDQVAETNVHVGSKDEVTTDHGDKSNDLIWETLNTIQMQIAGMQRDCSRSTSKRCWWLPPS